MGIPSSDVISVIYQLLPGFTAAWIFYGLTAHPKASPFERVVQALIFMAVIQAVVIPVRASAILLGKLVSLGAWTENSTFVVSMLLAAGLGFGFSVIANSSWLHSRLPDWITKRTSYPSEWFSAFNQDKRYVYLHLTGRRRIRGWPTEWPDQSDKGHFVLQDAAWILDGNERANLYLTERMLIRAEDVLMVEFEKDKTEWTHTDEQHEQSVSMLLEAQNDEVTQDGEREAHPDIGIGERSAAREGSRSVTQRITASPAGGNGRTEDVTTTAPTEELGADDE